MAWTNVLLTDQTGDNIGELSNVYDRSISWRAKRVTTQHFSVRLDDPLADRLLAGDLLVKSYNDQWGTDPAFVGEITDVEEIVNEQTKRIGVTCQDGTFRLTDRLVGKDLRVDGTPLGLDYSGPDVGGPQDRSVVLQRELEYINLQSDTGVRIGTVQPSGTDYIGPYYFKPFMEMLQEFSAALDGPYWELEPVEPHADTFLVWGGGPFPGFTIGTLHLYASKGTVKQHAVFAYSDHEDDRANVKDYRRTITKQGMLNTAYSLPPGFPDVSAGKVLTWNDAPSRARWRWREGVVPGDLVSDDMRLALTQQHVAVRRNPRETIVVGGLLPEDLTAIANEGRPRPYVPRFKIDYDVADVVPFRATVSGQTRFDGYVRVYGVDLAIDENGLETPTLSLTPE